MQLNASDATVTRFDTAAQKHANAFWFWLIISGIIGYLAGWWALIPAVVATACAARSILSQLYAARLRERASRQRDANGASSDLSWLTPMSFSAAEQIVHAYGRVIETSSHIHFADESKLPHPKQQIKSALAIALLSNTDAGERDALRAVYIMLADWQPGVGSDGCFSHKFFEQPQTGSAMEAANKIAELAPESDGLSLRASAERQQLLAELDAIEKLAGQGRSSAAARSGVPLRAPLSAHQMQKLER